MNVEDDGCHSADNGDATERPGEIWINHDSGESEVDGIAKCAVQEIDGRHQTSHVDRCARIGDSVS
jgi:hypothetical protein